MLQSSIKLVEYLDSGPSHGENFVLTWTGKQKSPQGALLCIKANLR